MIIYQYITPRGRVMRRYDLSSLQEAIKIAARDHNQGKTVDRITDDNTVYSRQDVLLMCDKLGLLR